VQGISADLRKSAADISQKGCAMHGCIAISVTLQNVKAAKAFNEDRSIPAAQWKTSSDRVSACPTTAIG